MKTLTITTASLESDLAALEAEQATDEIINGKVYIAEVWPRFWDALENEDYDALVELRGELDRFADMAALKLARHAFELKNWQTCFDFVRALKTDGLQPFVRDAIIKNAVKAL